jgi:hypothetical protein
MRTNTQETQQSVDRFSSKAGTGSLISRPTGWRAAIGRLEAGCCVNLQGPVPCCVSASPWTLDACFFGQSASTCAPELGL